MKVFIFVFIPIVLISGFFLLYSYFGITKQNTALYNPSVPESLSPLVSGDSTQSAQLESDIPVSCVLSFGTYMLTQSSCDEIMAIDAAPDPEAEMISCVLSDGTFSFTQRECDILKTASGSSDVMKTLD
ncbi:MAG: hypothetical protein M3Q44_02720 [bacterium]|nr:hypothetical protein [bacterium]